MKRMEQFGIEVKSVPGLSLFSKALLRGTLYLVPNTEWLWTHSHRATNKIKIITK